MSFADMKKKRGDKLQSLLKETAKINTPARGQGDDDRFWRPELDKSGNGMAVIRFLPAPEVDGKDALPWARSWNHGFQGPGGWYIENSLTTLGQKDPVSEYNSQLWNSGIEANKEIARKQKRRLTYVSNVLVLKDPANPQNEGQIRLYKYGKKIWDKINDVMSPDPKFEDETPVNPFDLWEGANFKLKIRKVDGFSNYDKSEFDSPSAVDGDDGKLEELWKSEHSLAEFTDPKNFKSYSELKEKMDRVLGLSTSPEKDDVPFDGGRNFTPAEAAASSATVSSATAESESTEEYAYFSKLAEGN